MNDDKDDELVIYHTVIDPTKNDDVVWKHGLPPNRPYIDFLKDAQKLMNEKECKSTKVWKEGEIYE